MSTDNGLLDALQTFAEAIHTGLATSVDSALGQRLANRLRTRMAAYFRGLADTFPYVEIAQVYGRFAITEAAGGTGAGKATDKVIEDWLAEQQYLLESAIVAGIEGAVESGYSAELAQWAEAMGWAPPETGFAVATNPKLMDWARTHAGQLVKGLNVETQKDLADLIAKGLEDQVGIPKLSRLIRQRFTDMAKERADMIAITETNDTLSQVALQAGKDVGADKKEWIRTTDFECDICGPNADQGRIPIDDTFESGHDAPSGHPRCHCSLATYGADPDKIAGLLAD